MYTLNDLVVEAKPIFEEVFGKIPKFKVDQFNRKSQYGECNYTDKTIYISKYYMERIPKELLVNTLIHEWLHEISPIGSGHKGEWVKLANKFNRTKYVDKYGIIKRTKDSSEYIDKEEKYKYIIKCKGCGIESGYNKESKVVKNYSHYRCGKCKSELERVR